MMHKRLTKGKRLFLKCTKSFFNSSKFSATALLLKTMKYNKKENTLISQGMAKGQSPMPCISASYKSSSYVVYTLTDII